jgi:hypothetical protein
MEKKSKFNIKNLFAAKEKLHKNLAKAPFEEKIKMLFNLQEIAKNMRPSWKS